MAVPADLRGVIDPRVGIRGFIERDRPALARSAEARLAERAANGGPGVAHDLAKAAVWGLALAVVCRIASRFRRR
jgi:hypothetical protein